VSEDKRLSAPKSIIVFRVPTAKNLPKWIAVLRDDDMDERPSIEDMESPRRHGEGVHGPP
jgi:hypothetical protein